MSAGMCCAQHMHAWRCGLRCSLPLRAHAPPQVCSANRWATLSLTGDLDARKRQALVDEFNSPAHPSFVLLLSSKADERPGAGRAGNHRTRWPGRQGARDPSVTDRPPSPSPTARGCGLNIVGANRLILLDPRRAGRQLWFLVPARLLLRWPFTSSSSSSLLHCCSWNPADDLQASSGPGPAASQLAGWPQPGAARVPAGHGTRVAGGPEEGRVHLPPAHDRHAHCQQPLRGCMPTGPRVWRCRRRACPLHSLDRPYPPPFPSSVPRLHRGEGVPAAAGQGGAVPSGGGRQRRRAAHLFPVGGARRAACASPADWTGLQRAER